MRAIIADVVGARRRGAGRADQQVRPRRSRRDRPARDARPRSTPRHAACDRPALDALTLARDRIEAYHRRQLPKDDRFTDALGVELGHRWTAIEAVGLYVPGGTAAYPSSVLMNAVPAKVAGVPRIVMVVPAPDGKLNPLVLAAAKLAGVDEIYRVGGAQAVAALAYGTATIKPVAKIVGPGNAYVAAAKRLVFGKVGIDMIAGPSEVLIVADRDGNPDWIAADLLAQAEHDASAQSILITDDAALADAVERAVEAQLKTLPRAEVAARVVARFRRHHPGRQARRRGAAGRRDRARASRDRVATTPSASPARIRNAGAIFLGAHTPEAIGDYVGGSNHVLPTARSARFSSGPRRARFHEAHLDPQMRAGRSLRALGPAAIALGEAEGLDAHARSVAIRLNPQMTAPATPDRNPQRLVGDARRGLDRPLQSRRRARARGRDLRPARGQQLRAGRSRRAGPYTLHLEHHRQPAGVRHPPRGRRRR